jgi:hypothetical protein
MPDGGSHSLDGPRLSPISLPEFVDLAVSLHSRHRKEFQRLDGATHRGVWVTSEHLVQRLGRVGLENRVASDRVAGVSAGLDHAKWGTKVDDRVPGLLSPSHPGIHSGLGLLRVVWLICSSAVMVDR